MLRTLAPRTESHVDTSWRPATSWIAPMDSEAELALVDRLRSVLTVTYVPLAGLVAALDTTSEVWALHLDTDSSAADHCWALIDVLRVLRLGPDAAQHATTAPPPRSVRRFPA